MAINITWLRLTACLLLACLLYMQGCSTVHKSRQTLPDDVPPAVELPHTPFYPQSKHQCGPAALATVLQSQQVDVTPETLSSQLYIPGRKGSLQIEMAVTARRYGMLPYPLAPRLSDLLVEIAAGNPVLVLQNLGFERWPQWHYAVVVGYDIANNELILRSGTTKRWVTSFEAFNNTWNRADNWALVIMPAGEIPVTASISTYLKTAYAFEETGLTRHALDAYRAATSVWPEHSSAWLALGNMLYIAGNSDEAVSALFKASRLSPATVSVWNNLAYALYKNGCAQQSFSSLQCAYHLSPDDDNIRDSEQEIKNMAMQPQTGNCPEIACN